MNKALPDTDIYSEILRAVNVTVIGHATTYRQAYGSSPSPSFTVMEMVKGFQQVQRPQKITDLLTDVAPRKSWRSPSLPLSLLAAFGATWKRTGQPIGLADPMIAAHRLNAWPGAGHWKHLALPAYPTARISPHVGQLAPVTTRILVSVHFTDTWCQFILLLSKK